LEFAVELVQHDHERFRTRPECRREPRRRTPQRRYTEASNLGDQVGGAIREPREHGRKQHEQHCRIVVEAIERDPGNATILGVGPLSQERRFAVPRGRRNADYTATAPSSFFDQVGATHGTWTWAWDGKLRIDQ
jgi:hypothetical protein